MVTALDLGGEYELTGVTARDQPVPDVQGRLLLAAAGPEHGSFVSTSQSDFGEQEESGTFVLESNLMLATIQEATIASMRGMVLRLRCTIDNDQLTLAHEDPDGNQGALVQVWRRIAPEA